MTEKPKFIYFDLDDTLIDHRQAERNALHDIHRYFNLFDPLDVNQLVDTYHRINGRQWTLYSRAEVTKEELQRNRFEITLRELGLDESRYEEIGTQYMQYYQNHWEWIPGAQEAFQSIKRDFHVGILTNGFAETQQKKFARFDLYNQADHLVISEHVGVMKPHSDVFEYASNLTGCKPEEILYIGDSFSSDVVGGVEYGWKVAWFTENGETQQREEADFVFCDFKELIDQLEIQS